MAQRHCSSGAIASAGGPHCYVTSLRTTAKALLQHVRDRWSIENSWHWPRDTQLKEDAHRYREPNGVRILATLCSLAM
jgi:predicted transposase YbfD/YdcC